MFLETVLLGICFLAIIYYICRCFWNGKPVGFPPGPPAIPLLGSLPFLPKRVITGEFKLFDYLYANFGKVSGCLIGTLPIIYITDASLLKQVFKMDESLGLRSLVLPFHKLRYGHQDGKSRGLLFSVGEEWQEQRRFIVRSLKDHGFGKMSMEDSINRDVGKLVSFLVREKLGKPINLDTEMKITIVNALWNLLVGEELSLQDPKLLRIVKIIDDVAKQWKVPKPLLLLMGTWAVELLDPSFKSFVSLGKALEDLIIPYILAHKKTCQEENNDFIDTYLKEIQHCSDRKSSFWGTRGEESLLASLMDLFLGGIETTSSTLSWGILYMLHHPDIQKRVQDELDTVLDSKRQASIEDKMKLPYTCAVINEIMRNSNIIPSAGRTITKAINVNGLVIPQGSFVVGNITGMHKDPTIWKNPDLFDPTRFIDNNGSCKGSDKLMNFSSGKRSCPGQTLAEKELFLFFVGLMQAFEFRPVPGGELPSCNGFDVESNTGVVKCAPLYEVILINREKSHFCY